MNKKVVLLIIAASAAAVGIIAVLSIHYIPLPLKNSSSVSSAFSDTSAVESTSALSTGNLDSGVPQVLYTIKNYNGKVAVFVSNSSDPETVYDVYVDSFPPADQEILQNGITLTTREELEQRLEDYIS